MEISLSIRNFIMVIIVVTSVANASLAGRYHRHHKLFPGTQWGQPKLSTPEECDRTCIDGQPPKTCYYHFTVEYYATLTHACDLCRSNATTRVTEDCQCIEGDGYELAGIITANRMYPGPAIMVCLNDYVVIDVKNHVPGSGITIHWHGLFQNGYQYYDGVPYVTQCPIQEGTTFRYQFDAANPGTHFWHAHTGLHKAEGLEGTLVVREPRETEPNSRLWDYDLTEHVIFLTDFLHEGAASKFPGTLVNKPGQNPDNILINGMGQFTDPATQNTTTTPLAVFKVTRGYHYRFRMINSCSMTCPYQLSVQGHRLTVIATDGENVEPVVVDSITSFSAERYDFIINANQPIGNYWIQVRGLAGCARRNMQQLAILRYESAPTNVGGLERPTYGAGVPPGLVLNQLNVRCNGDESPADALCVSNLRSADPVPIDLLKPEPDVRLYLPFGFWDGTPEEVFKSGTYNKFLVAGGGETAGLVANISNVLPASNLLTQRWNIPNSQICTSKNMPARCTSGKLCECTHIEELPLDAVVEIILVDEAQIPGLSHPFHLHGHAFRVIGEGCGDEFNITSIDVDIARELDEAGLMHRYLKKPPGKDTYAIPNNGFSIIRFIANNPGYWLFHCHFLYHLAAGMSAIFHVGEITDLPPIPLNFPKCGDFLPPIEY